MVGGLGLVEVFRRIRGQPSSQGRILLRGQVREFEVEAFEGVVDKRDRRRVTRTRGAIALDIHRNVFLAS